MYTRARGGIGAREGGIRTRGGGVRARKVRFARAIRETFPTGYVGAINGLPPYYFHELSGDRTSWERLTCAQSAVVYVRLMNECTCTRGVKCVGAEEGVHPRGRYQVRMYVRAWDDVRQR